MSPLPGNWFSWVCYPVPHWNSGCCPLSMSEWFYWLRADSHWVSTIIQTSYSVNQALICALWLDILPGLLHTLPVDIVVLVDRSPLTICNVACCRVLFLNMKVCHCLHWHPFARSLSVFNKKSLQVRNWLDPMQNLVCSQVYMSTVDLEKSPSRFCDTNCLVCYDPSIFRLIHTKPS
jgi:hypothetical protein